MSSHKLICTFIKKDKLYSIVTTIKKKFQVKFNKILVLQSIQNPDTFYCIYHIPSQDLHMINDIHNTIVVHRNKQTNTIFTINSLNHIVQQVGEYIINWNKYENSVVLFLDGILKINKTTLNRVIRF